MGRQTIIIREESEGEKLHRLTIEGMAKLFLVLFGLFVVYIMIMGGGPGTRLTGIGILILLIWWIYRKVRKRFPKQRHRSFHKRDTKTIVLIGIIVILLLYIVLGWASFRIPNFLSGFSQPAPIKVVAPDSMVKIQESNIAIEKDIDTMIEDCNGPSTQRHRCLLELSKSLGGVPYVCDQLHEGVHQCYVSIAVDTLNVSRCFDVPRGRLRHSGCIMVIADATNNPELCELIEVTNIDERKQKENCIKLLAGELELIKGVLVKP